MCFPHWGPALSLLHSPRSPVCWGESSRAELLEQKLLCCPGPASPREARLEKQLRRLCRAVGDGWSILQSTLGTQGLFCCTNAIPCP